MIPARTVRAVVLKAFGGPIALEEVPRPKPGPGQVLVDVQAVGVNYSDNLVIEGKYQSAPPLPFTLGKGVAGIVAEVGDGVSSVRAGQRVNAYIESGGFADLAIAPACNVYPVAESIDFNKAAAIGHAAQTAYFTLVDRLKLEAGETLLVTGASGVIGRAVVEMAKAFGARVLAGVRSSASADIAMASGADDIIDLGKESLRESLRDQVHALTLGRGADGIVELLGGDVFDASVRALAWRGRIAVLGFVAGTIPTLRMNYPLLKTIGVTGLQWSDYRDREPEWVGRAQTEINNLLTSGKLQGHVAGVFKLEEFATALEVVRIGSIHGKILLSPQRNT